MFIPKDLLNIINSRASHYDQTNSFPIDDFNDLKSLGYLKAYVPKEFGGLGLSLQEILNEQINLSKAAPSTALSFNMHQIIVGLGNYLIQNNQDSGKTILNLAANNNFFSFAISEAGNDRVLFGSTTKAVSVKNGYLLTGKKIFITNSNHFDYLLTYAHDDKTNESVFGLLEKNTDGISVLDDWDALGMRASDSNTIVLDNVLMKNEHILAKIPAGFSKEPIIFGIFSHFEMLLAATYHGIGLRALELGINIVSSRKSILNNSMYANDKDIRWRIAEAAIILDGVKRDLMALATDFVQQKEDPLWFVKFSTIKNKAVETSIKALDEIIRASGGSSYKNNNELSRLYRDVLAGIFQPSDQESLHNSWANALLGPIK